MENSNKRDHRLRFVNSPIVEIPRNVIAEFVFESDSIKIFCIITDRNYPEAIYKVVDVYSTGKVTGRFISILYKINPN